MGYRGKLLVEDLGIELPKKFVEKYKKKYYIGRVDGKYILSLASKCETKYHGDIIADLKEILKKTPYNVWAVILWEDGVVDRHNLTTSQTESFGIRNFDY